MGLPSGTVVKNLSANAGDAGLIPQSGRSPGEGNGNPFQYSCLGNPMDRGAWRATVHAGCKELNMSEHACTRFYQSLSSMRKVISLPNNKHYTYFPK